MTEVLPLPTLPESNMTTTKKQKVTAPHIPLAEFSLQHNARILSPQGDFIAVQRQDGLPIYLEVRPEGMIPSKFGLKADKNGHWKLRMNVTNESDQNDFKRLDQELSIIGLNSEPAWKTLTSKPATWKAQFQTFLSTHQDSTKKYPPLFSSTFNPSDFANGKIIVRHYEDGSLVTNMTEIAGSICVRIVFELLGFVLSKENPIAISSRTKNVWIKKGNFTTYEYVIPSLINQHDPNCQLKHVMPFDLSTFDFNTFAEFLPWKTREVKADGDYALPIVGIQVKDNPYSPVCLRATKGFLPKFVCSYGAEHDTYSLQFQLSDESEKKSAYALTTLLEEESVNRRNEWFKALPHEKASNLQSWVEGFYSQPKPKLDKDKQIIPDGGFWPGTGRISIPSDEFIPEPKEIKSEDRIFELKPTSKIWVEDCDGNRIFKLCQLKKCQLSNIEFYLKCVYFQKKATKYATELKYIKLGRNREDYDADDEMPTHEQEEQDQSQ